MMNKITLLLFQKFQAFFRLSIQWQFLNTRHSLASSEKVSVSIWGVEESSIYSVFRKACAQLLKGFRISMIQSGLAKHPVLITYMREKTERNVSSDVNINRILQDQNCSCTFKEDKFPICTLVGSIDRFWQAFPEV